MTLMGAREVQACLVLSYLIKTHIYRYKKKQVFAYEFMPLFGNQKT